MFKEIFVLESSWDKEDPLFNRQRRLQPRWRLLRFFKTKKKTLYLTVDEVEVFKGTTDAPGANLVSKGGFESGSGTVYHIGGGFCR